MGLSKEMQRAMELLKQGELHRLRGGWWWTKGYICDGTAQPFIGTNTLTALEKRGLIEPCETRVGDYGRFITAYKLR